MSPSDLYLYFAQMFFTILPWFVGGTAAVMLFSRSSLGKAVIHRLRHGNRDDEIPTAVRTELEQVRLQLTELQERVDFTERVMLRERADVPELPASRQPRTPTPV